MNFTDPSARRIRAARAAPRSRANNLTSPAPGGAKPFQARLLIRAWKQSPPDARPSAGAREGRASAPWWLLIGMALLLAGALPADGAPFEQTSGCQRSAAPVLAAGAKHATWSLDKRSGGRCWTAGWPGPHRRLAAQAPRPPSRRPQEQPPAPALRWPMPRPRPWPGTANYIVEQAFYAIGWPR